MITAAAKRGYEYYGISDHTIGLGVASGLSGAQLLKHQQAIYRAAKKFPRMHVLAGAEVNIKADGTLDIPAATLAKLDYAIGSVHSSFNQNEADMTKRILAAVRHPAVKILGHPSGRILGERQEYDVEWIDVFKACAKHQVAIEINAFPSRLDLKDIYVKEALSYGCQFIINTDAHHASHLDGIRYGIAVARRGWARAQDVVNAWPYKKFRAWLDAKKPTRILQ